MPHGSSTTRPITRVGPEVRGASTDLLAVEEPLEIRVRYGEERHTRALSVTMRTPGSDLDLAAGFLFTEGIVRGPGDILDIQHCGAPSGSISNTVRVDLHREVDLDLARLERHFYTSSSCGVCGKTSLEAVQSSGVPELPRGPRLHAATLLELPGRLRQAQAIFEGTGGCHATGLFSPSGELLAIREDVGRHNAMDKVIGHYLRQGVSDLSEAVVVVSGRASFELIQKALMARVTLFVAVGAPSSLAIDLAIEHGMTVAGFVRGGRLNLYSGEQRVA